MFDIGQQVLFPDLVSVIGKAAKRVLKGLLARNELVASVRAICVNIREAVKSLPTPMVW